MFWGRRKNAKLGKYEENPSLATAEVLAELIEKCPNCKQEFNGHRFAQLATRIISKDKGDKLENFFGALVDHNWPKLTEFQTWDPLSDDVEAFAIRCSDGGLSVVVIKTHFELFQGNRLLYCEALPDEEGKKLLAAFPAITWHSSENL